MRYVGCYWELDYNMWISVGSALMRRSSLIWQLAFPEGLGAAAGIPRVAPSTPVIFDVQLLYTPGVSDFDEQKADDPKDLPINRGMGSPLK
jgi:hypothetical protein